MNELCATSLCRIVRGELQLSTLPPLGGAWEPVCAVQLDASCVRPGDVLMMGGGLDERLVGRRQFAEEAFARQAIGVVTSQPHVEPWAGTFAIRVANARIALMELAQWQRRQYGGTLITFMGSVRGERLADSLERLLENWGNVQRIGFAGPYDAVAVSQAMLNLRDEADFVITVVPVDDTEGAAMASQLLRPNLAVNCLRQTRYAEVASIREVRATIAHQGTVLTVAPLMSVQAAAATQARIVRVGVEGDEDIVFHLDTAGQNQSLVRLSNAAFNLRPQGRADDDLLLLATCLQLGMNESTLAAVWRELFDVTKHRHAA